MIKTFNTLFVTMFGLGKIPKIPGTFGTLTTVINPYFFFSVFIYTPNFILICFYIFFVFFFFTGDVFFKDYDN